MRNENRHARNTFHLPKSVARSLENDMAAEADGRVHAALVARTEAHSADLIRYHGHGVLWPSYYVGRDRQWGGR